MIRNRALMTVGGRPLGLNFKTTLSLLPAELYLQAPRHLFSSAFLVLLPGLCLSASSVPVPYTGESGAHFA